MEKVLVVLSLDLIRPDKPKQSLLIQCAISLAKITGCELELLHVCYDGGPTRDMDISALDEIFSARARLETEQVKDGNGQMELHGVSRHR